MPQVELGKVLGFHKPKLKNLPDNRLILPYTHIGMEFEFEKVGKITKDEEYLLSTYWTDKKDDSLHDGGREYVFASPLFGADVTEAVTNLLSVAQSNQWACTLRTGIHVHMDARDLTVAQLRGMLAYYLILEPAIYAWVGDGREANNFCLPWYKSEGSIQDAIRILRSMDSYTGTREGETVVATCGEFHKYAGLNLQALSNYGSLEFRQLRTTLDPARVIQWLNMLLSIKKAAMDAPSSTMSIVSDAVRRGMFETLRAVFDRSTAKEILDKGGDDVLKDMRAVGCSNAIEFIVESLNQNKAYTYESVPVAAKATNHPGIDKWMGLKFPKGVAQAEPMPSEEDPFYDEDFSYFNEIERLFGTATAVEYHESMDEDRRHEYEAYVDADLQRRRARREEAVPTPPQWYTLNAAPPLRVPAMRFTTDNMIINDTIEE